VYHNCFLLLLFRSSIYTDVLSGVFVSQLQICVKGKITRADVDMLISQFRNMELMHRVLKYRKLVGKNIPKDESAMKLAMQEDVPKVMTKNEKRDMRKEYAKTAF